MEKEKWFAFTALKMAVVLIVSLALTNWYLSYHPIPRPNEDGVLMMVLPLTSVWIVFLIWKIDCLKDDVARFKKEATDAKDFIGIFVHPSRVEKVLASMAGGLRNSFGVALRVQQECQGDVTEELKMVQATVERDKTFFWRAVDLGHRLMNVKPKKSYKNYLPTNSWQGGIPDEEV